jgi:Domain of unknown function (DUF4382)
MARSRLEFERSSSWDLQRFGCCVVILFAAALAGCGNSCFAGFSNNGTGVIVIKAGNPPPACSLTQGNGTMQVVAVKSAVCESCPATNRLQHVFVTLQGIKLHSSAIADANSPDWLEIAPQLANEPRQIDLMGDPAPEMLVEMAAVPAGTYHQVRLLFLGDSDGYAGKLLPENACGQEQHNCVVMADGRVQPLGWPADVSAVLITSEAMNGGSLAVLPGGRTDLRLSFQPHQMFHSSTAEPLGLRTFLVGHAATAPRSSIEQPDSAAK